MQRLFTNISLFAVLAVSISCTAGSVNKSVKKMIEQDNERVGMLCACEDDDITPGLSDESECNDELQATESNEECIAEALGKEPDASKLWIDCIEEANKPIQDCFDDGVECEESDELDDLNDCVEDATEDAQEARKDCIGLPTSVAEDYADCFGGGDSEDTEKDSEPDSEDDSEEPTEE